MRTEQRSTVWLEKFIYGILVICVTSFGTLIYSDAFTPEHEHIYHLSLLTHSHVHNPLPPPAAGQRGDLKEWGAHAFLFGSEWFSRAQTPSGLTYFFQSGLSHGYLLTVGPSAAPQSLPRWGGLPLIVYQGDSVWLPPPDKPPIV